ncbi:MAG: NAD(P)H-dependent oxidoreductase [Proteobacteria bacterium]|nr:NAD(P)H-dependent oxidoreductase [Pseudomonadota bacterium]
MAATVAVVIGSLRKQAWSRKVATEIIHRAQGKLNCHILEIGDLPLYNEDLDAQPPLEWKRFRTGIDASDAVLFVTPEYNRSVPGVLKNALDIGSRPGNQNHWSGKPAAVVSQTPYKLGAFGANHALRQTFVFLDMPVLQQPEMYIGTVGDKFDSAGKLTDSDTGKLLDAFIAAFAGWIARAAKPESFPDFMKRRDSVATAYVNGDGSPLDSIITRTDPATFLSPGGDAVTGAAVVANRYKADAAHFTKGSTSKLEVLQSANGQLGFWTGIQHAEVKMQGKEGAIPMSLRVTEVFRLEGGHWHLIHRHADMGTSK